MLEAEEAALKLRLTVIVSGQAFQQVELERFTRVRIGRAEDCEVHLDNAAVSRYHCEIVLAGGVLRINDLGGQNGTVLNGVLIKRHGLKHGDVITIGKLTIDVEVDREGKTSRRDRAPSGKMTLDGDRESLAKAQREGEVRVRGYLTFPDKRSERHVPLEQARYVFGRDPEADVRVGWMFAPRLSAVILREHFGFRIIDLSARGGCVRVNGARATDTRLSHNDQLQVRGQRFRFSQGKAP